MENSSCCKIPNTNRDFWVAKIRRNKERDKEEQRKLASMGWHCITVWECELTPKKQEETLESIAFTLNHIWLQDHQTKVVSNPQIEEGNMRMPIAAEEERMKQIEVVAAIIRKGDKIFATQRGYGDWKDWWEFPGGKMEAGETPEEALKREIREELSTEISVDKFLCTVEYDYPAFHLIMHCYLCSLVTEALHLNEHEAAKWLSKDELGSVKWLPADLEVINNIINKAQ